MLSRISCCTLFTLGLLACGGEPEDLSILSGRAEVGDSVFMIKHLGSYDIPKVSGALSLNKLKSGVFYSLELLNQESIPGVQLTFLKRDTLIDPPTKVNWDKPFDDLDHEAIMDVDMVLAATTRNKTLIEMPEECADQGCTFKNEMLDSGKDLGLHESQICLPNFEPTDTMVRVVFFIQQEMDPRQDHRLQVKRTMCTGSLPAQQEDQTLQQAE